MEKLSENVTIGCASGCYINPILYNACSVSKLICRLHEYEELDLTPDEIHQILKDGEELADAYIGYKNRCAQLESVLSLRNINALEKKAEAYDRISDMGIFSVDDIEQWKEKADKYDELVVCSLDSTSELRRKAARYDKIVEALCDIFLHK